MSLWKWVSQNRLFHLGAKQCLGLDIFTKLPSRLRMVDCNSDLRLWWRCADGSVVGASQYKVTVKSAYVTASINASDQWRSNNSSGDICQYPYHEVYTKDGNSYGKPCEFPFLYNATWHHDCIQDGTQTGGKWCATSEDYTRDGKWGICLQPEDGCRDIWEHDAGSQHCYQFNTQSALSWKEAYISCQRQGGDLLSIQDASELNYIQAKDDIAEIFWIGLNQLDVSRGWQWSDHKPLNFVNWHQGNDVSGGIEIFRTETSILFFSFLFTLLLEFWRHLDTRCDVGWLPHNGFCYMMMHNQASWSTADQFCKTNKSNLISIHSLADVELIVTKLHNEEVWMGLRNEDVPTLFKWSDHTDVVFTYWDQNEPNVPFNATPNCVSYSGKGWEMHGNYCYKILKTEVSFGALCNLTVTNRFEQEFINSLIRKHTKVEEKYFWTGLQDISQSGMYSWAAVDGEKSEAVTYTNWNSLQPEFSGGCVVMSSGRSLGKWETKDCKTTKAFPVCKKYIGLPKEPEVLPKPSDPCPPGWHNGSGLACYKFFHSERVLRTRTWEEAERFCEALGGHLPSFTHTEEIKIFFQTKFEEILLSIQDNTSFLESKYVEDDSRNCGVFKVNRTVFPAHCNEKREWICKIPKGVKPKNPDWYIAELPWSYYQGAEYLFHVNPTDWDTYEFICVWLRSEMATINSAEEQAFIENKIKKLSDSDVHWWIGLHAENISNEFRWKDESLVTYQNWNEGRDRYLHKPGKRCGFISSQTGRWDDENCTVSLPCICKRKNAWKIEKEIPKDRNPQGMCPKGWLHFGLKCFLIQIPKDPEHLRSWYSAQTFCSRYDGSLASLEDELEQAFITMNLFGRKTSVWIAFQGDDYEKWMNENPPRYSNWSPIEVVHRPRYNSVYVEEQVPLCTLVSNNPNFYFTGKWYLENCEKNYGFVCQKRQDTSRHIVNASEMYPVPDTLQYANRTYTLIRGNLTWSAALKTCMANGAELVSIADQYHQAFLTIIVNRLGYNHWIGLFTADNGLNFEWSDGTRSLFTFWEDDESQALGSCVYMDTSGHWKSTSCEQILPGAVCHVPPKKKLIKYKGLCSEKHVPWIKFKNNCYSFNTVLQGTSFDTAYEVCRNQGSNLLTIEDEDENAFILEELHSFGYSVKMVWLNVLHVKDNETVSWFDGSPLNYSNWGIREPEFDHLKGNFCISLRTADGVWQISPCREIKGFVCKKDADLNAAEPSEKSSYSGLAALAVLVTLVMLAAISIFLWCLYKQNNRFFSRILWVRNAYFPQINSDVPALEESILISDFEKDDN
uniref:Uncharacterized protein n=1 Tax=Meleagris gallopavo TaxID=9103 RepID=G1NF25_MELGA